MWWYMGVGMARDIGVWINASSRGGPIRWGSSKETGWCDRHRRRVWGYKVHLLLMGMVRRHVGDIWWILVHWWFSGVRLESLGNAMKVKFVGIPFAMHFGHNVLIIVVSEGSAQLVIIHIGLAFAFSPAPCHFIRVRHLEFPIGPFPCDTAGVGTVRQQLEEELPQLDLPTPCKKQAKWKEMTLCFLLKSKDKGRKQKDYLDLYWELLLQALENLMQEWINYSQQTS